MLRNSVFFGSVMAGLITLMMGAVQRLDELDNKIHAEQDRRAFCSRGLGRKMLYEWTREGIILCDPQRAAKKEVK